ncbi:MAG TPA: NADPH:quinone reductase [Geminicoccaceae bacterium]|nr:NADPH:quinone reductase [Geminicoccaceae bacterium]
MSAAMRAAWYEATGPAREVIRIGELPRPEPGSGEVLVRVHASGLNPSDTKRRAGWRREALEYPRVIPHSDGAGVIEAVGAGVDDGRIGERVWLWNAQRGRAGGTCADYVALPQAQAVPLPDGTGFVDGACLGVPACTAHFAALADGPLVGLTALIQGGAGAVGDYAVQWAKRSGAHVIATVGSDAKAALARQSGADATVNRRAEDVVRRVLDLTDGQGVDRIVEVDLGANLEQDVALIKPNGVIASYSSTANPEPVFPYYPLAYKGVTLRLVQAYILPEPARARALADIGEALRDGGLGHRTAGVFPLEETAAAHELLESGKAVGNVVVTLI